MVKRPRVFELQDVEAELREQGVPADSIGPTISFMRLVIPLIIRQVGADGIVRFIEDTLAEWGRTDESGWAKGMAPYIVKWAEACLEKYKAERALAHRVQNQGG